MTTTTSTRAVRHGIPDTGRLIAAVAISLALALALVSAPAAQADGVLYGETYLISTSSEDKIGGEPATFGAISKDGLHTFWSTKESMLSTDSNNGNVDIYERIDTHTTRLVTPGGNYDATFLAISEDGSKVFFSTDEPLAGDSDTKTDIYRRNLDHNPATTTLMTPGTNENVRFRGSNLAGDRVFFESTERLAGDSDDEQDVFMSADGAITRISAGNEACTASYAGATPDGRHVFFSSKEWLTADDTGPDDATTCQTGLNDRGTGDVFRWSNGSVTNVTPTQNLISGVSATFKDDRFLATSPDGSRVIFAHDDQGCFDDIFAFQAGAVTKLSPSQWDDTPQACNTGKGYYAATFVGASADATKVFWISREPGLAGDDDGSAEKLDIYLTSGGGAPQLMTPSTPTADASFRWTSADGNQMVFETTDSVVDDTDTRSDVFLNAGGTITKVSTGPLGGNGAFNAGFSGATPDGEFIFFRTDEKLTSDDADIRSDIYVRHDGDTELITAGPGAGDLTVSPIFNAVTDDGDRVFFTTGEELLPVDTDTRDDIYMRWRGGPPSVLINEFSLAPDSFVELLKSGEGQDEFPDEDGPYKLVAYDAGGDKIADHVINPVLLRGQVLPLFSDTLPEADERLELSLPPAGQVCFTQGPSEARVSCVAWGCLTAAVDVTVNHLAAPVSGKSQQRQLDTPGSFEIADPTPKTANVAGTTAPACGSDPDDDGQDDDPPAKTVTPKLKLTAKPGRDRVAPYVYTLRGSLTGAFAASPQVCGGNVVVKVKQGKRVVAKKTVRVNAKCQVTAKVRIKGSKIKGKGKAKLKVLAGYSGHPSDKVVLRAAKATTTVRAR